ncbi:MAG: GNAT family N-acetyltransferase [Ilumatobacteraceae bacterium]
MITIETANADDIDQLVALESKLFHEDAGRHDKFADVTWPEREGHHDFTKMLADSAYLLLVARDGCEVVGHLVGYLSRSSPTRQQVTYSVLRSMYVESDSRCHGIGHLLTERFVSWSRDNGCVEAHVDSYVANDPAQRFYERHGFASQSQSRVLPL